MTMDVGKVGNVNKPRGVVEPMGAARKLMPAGYRCMEACSCGLVK